MVAPLAETGNPGERERWWSWAGDVLTLRCQWKVHEAVWLLEILTETQERCLDGAFRFGFVNIWVVVNLWSRCHPQDKYLEWRKKKTAWESGDEVGYQHPRMSVQRSCRLWGEGLRDRRESGREWNHRSQKSWEYFFKNLKREWWIVPNASKKLFKVKSATWENRTTYYPATPLLAIFLKK